MDDGHAVGPVVRLFELPCINEAGIPDTLAVHQTLLQFTFDTGHRGSIPQQVFRGARW